jgi:hypothetical protein
LKVQYFPSWDTPYMKYGIGFFPNTDSNRIKYICVFYFHFFVFLDVLFRTFDVILQWRQNMCHAIFHVCGFTWRKILYFQYKLVRKAQISVESYLVYQYSNDFFLLEVFWLDVTTSKDECTCTRLNSVVSIRKRPFTEE